METARVTPRRASWKPACANALRPSPVPIPICTCSGVSWVKLLGARAGNTTKRLWEEEGERKGGGVRGEGGGVGGEGKERSEERSEEKQEERREKGKKGSGTEGEGG